MLYFRKICYINFSVNTTGINPSNVVTFNFLVMKHQNLYFYLTFIYLDVVL